MYISRRKPTTRDSMIVVIRRMVAEKAVCSWEGRKRRRKRPGKGAGAAFGGSGGEGIQARFYTVDSGRIPEPRGWRQGFVFSFPHSGVAPSGLATAPAEGGRLR